MLIYGPRNLDMGLGKIYVHRYCIDVLCVLCFARPSPLGMHTFMGWCIFTDCFENSCKFCRFISCPLLLYCFPGSSLLYVHVLTFQQFRSLVGANSICSSWIAYTGLVSLVPSVAYTGVFPFLLLILYLFLGSHLN
jgi:hypothetical protein